MKDAGEDSISLSSPENPQLSPVLEQTTITPNCKAYPLRTLSGCCDFDSSDGNIMATPEIPARRPLTRRHRSMSYPSRGIDLDNVFSIRRMTSTATPNMRQIVPQGTSKLSPAQIHELMSDQDSLPVRKLLPDQSLTDQVSKHTNNGLGLSLDDDTTCDENIVDLQQRNTSKTRRSTENSRPPPISRLDSLPPYRERPLPYAMSRTYSTPSSLLKRRPDRDHRRDSTLRPSPFPPNTNRIDDDEIRLVSDPRHDPFPSPPLTSIPLPPFSMPAYLQLELSSERPSPLYIHRSTESDVLYETFKVKFDRLVNFFSVPPVLEHVLLFGVLACLDAWLYMFTILPLRFTKALSIYLIWLGRNCSYELHDIATFIHLGALRLWHRHRRRSHSRSDNRVRSFSDTSDTQNHTSLQTRQRHPSYRHRRTRSTPSTLQHNHKADILQGLLIITSCIVLSRFDASRMYHAIRGQAAIKLYVIYNVLEVFDRLFSALGQDILECLFSHETLDRNEHGRSKVFRPLWLFMLALCYCVSHSIALFYQVITLNVAVNSYSNALLTLLMSNQFVEIKGTVFKKIEKENLFQLTCADIVERFQIWLMLFIIALRNLVEASSLPTTLSFLPSHLAILHPFLIVLGSEMAVDWFKHAYITKFNALSSTIYTRFLDVLAKDYYSHAFAAHTLPRRLGLPVIPLACLFIRASLQTYHMLLATNVATPRSSATALAQPASSAVLAQLDAAVRRALGQSSLGGGVGGTRWSVDDGIALGAMVVVFAALFLLLLVAKLALGMLLLGLARGRYVGMKGREAERMVDPGVRRIGGYGAVQVSEGARRTIYEGDAEGLRRLREKEGKEKSGRKLEGVSRYEMIAKRIW